MLKEHTTRQVSGDPRRRWFFDDSMDLIVWVDEDSTILGFQLCYEFMRDELAFTWTADSGYSNSRVDTGEASPEKNLSPILIRDRHFPKERVLKRFRSCSTDLDQGIRRQVLSRLAGYPER